MIGFLIWLLLFAVSMAALAIAIRCAWSLRKSLYATAAFKEKLIPLLKQGDWQGAFDYCEAHSTLAAKIINEDKSDMDIIFSGFILFVQMFLYQFVFNNTGISLESSSDGRISPVWIPFLNSRGVRPNTA